MLTLLVAWRAAQLIATARCQATMLARQPPASLITAFYMPSRHSQDDHRTAAHTLADELGVELRTVPIDEATDREAGRDARDARRRRRSTELTRQNIQARIRGQRMWNWANSSGALFLQTGDMSEKAVGYTTIGGDLEGALSVIANVPKTVVIALLERLHRRFGFEGIAATLATRAGPRARRRAGRRGRADAVSRARRVPAPLRRREDVARRGRRRRSSASSPTPRDSRRTSGPTRFAKLFTQSIYKWVQSPLSLHVGSLDLDRERALQMPVVQKTRMDERSRSDVLTSHKDARQADYARAKTKR